MDETTLSFIVDQLRKVLAAQQEMRSDLTIVQQELMILRSEVRLVRSVLAGVDDTLTMNVLERIQKLESK